MKPYPCGHLRTDANTRVRRRYDRPGTVARVCRICTYAMVRKAPSSIRRNRKERGTTGRQ